MSTSAKSNKQKMNVQSFPRPPLLEKIPRHLLIAWDGKTVVETKDSFWALETHHPPSKFFPFAQYCMYWEIFNEGESDNAELVW